MNPVEEQIIPLLAEGDRRAIALIYDHYAEALYGILLRLLRDEAEAQDVMQESFVKIWKNARRYDARQGRLFTWLLNIARNTARDRLRQRKRERELPLKDGEAWPVSPLQFSEPMDQEKAELPANLQKLDPKYREVINAVYFMGLTQEEAGEHLDIPLGTVKSRVRIALRELRKLLGAYLLMIGSWLIS